MTVFDRLRWWCVLLIPRFVCLFLWQRTRVSLSTWGPFILGRIMGGGPPCRNSDAPLTWRDEDG